MDVEICLEQFIGDNSSGEWKQHVSELFCFAFVIARIDVARFAVYGSWRFSVALLIDVLIFDQEIPSSNVLNSWPT